MRLPEQVTFLKKTCKNVFNNLQCSTLSRFTCPGCCSTQSRRIRPSMETLLKLSVLGSGLVLESTTGLGDAHNGHHIMMILFFSVHCIFELIYASCCNTAEEFVPQGLDYLSAVIAFAVEALLFSWHLEVNLLQIRQTRTIIFA